MASVYYTGVHVYNIWRNKWLRITNKYYSPTQIYNRNTYISNMRQNENIIWYHIHVTNI